KHILNIKIIRENPEKVKQGARNKSVEVYIDKLLELDKKRREIIAESEQVKSEQNKLNSKGAPTPETIETAKALKEKFQAQEEILKGVEAEFDALMRKIPNPAFDEVPVGKDDSQNVVKEIGKIKEKPKFDFKPKEHWEIGEALDIIDTKRAVKVAGSRFYYFKGGATLLEFALINFALEKVVAKGFTPIIPPVMIKREMAKATGYFEQTDEKEAYYLPEDDMFLVGTSEQSLITMHAGEILEEDDLPLRYVGFSTCFRREAGSYGKDTNGILRVHQFDKLEMIVLCKPEDSAKEHEQLLAIEKELMDGLRLHYQVIDICTGDLGMPAAKKYDIEVWLPGQGRYRETHSTSNCTDFQARRLNIKYKDRHGKLNFVHILNGTAFSMRPIIAILENYQKKDGTVEVPKVLQKYFGLKKISAKK
ncbi:MAG: serine--tRNA ligase, partial [Candidatus Pacebacteria bacterium]|nr:serine--tRNA ligase [Candidatus Paceibacterota bacterium]